MARLGLPGAWAAKPPVGVHVQHGHPLAQGLLCCHAAAGQAGMVLSDAAGRFSLPAGSRSTWRFNGHASDPDGGSGDTGASQTWPTSWQVNTLTLFWHGYLFSAGTENAVLYGIPANNSDSDPYFACSISRRSSGASGLSAEWSKGPGTYTANQINSSPNTYQWYSLAVTYDGPNTTVRGYEGGVQKFSSSSNVGTPGYSATSTLDAGTYAGGRSRSPKSVLGVGAAWSRVLTAAEIRWLASDPYAFLVPT